MLVIRTPNLDAEGQWFKFKVRGEELDLKIRPFSAEVYNKIRKSHRSTKIEKDMSTRQVAKIEVFDEDSITEDIIDYLLEDFKGIVDETGTILLATKTNKKLLCSLLPASDDDTSVFDFIFGKARDIAAISEEEFKRIEKNL